MDWKRIIRDEIAEHKRNKESIENMEKRITRCEEDKTAIRNAHPGGVRAKGGSGRTDDRWASLIVEEQMAKEQLEKTKRKVDLVEEGLKRLDKREKDILEKMSCREYGDNTVDELCEKYAIEQATVYRIWNQAAMKYKAIQFGHE